MPKTLLVAAVFGIVTALGHTAIAKSGDKTESRSPVIIEIFAKLPAEASGIKSGDQVIAVNDEPITRSEEFVRLVHLHRGSPTKITFKNGTSKVVVPNSEGRIGVRISDLNDAIVVPSRQKPLTVTKYQSNNTGSKADAKQPTSPIRAQVSPGTHVQILFEETAYDPRTSSPSPVCVFQIPMENLDVRTGKIAKGGWTTPSEYMLPAHGAAHHLAKPITHQQGELLRADMFLAKVTEILGAPGDRISRSKFKDVVAETWIWQNANGSYLCCNFENNKLTYKSGYLLQ